MKRLTVWSLIALLMIGPFPPVIGTVQASGIPVFDGSNMTQNIISAMESVTQTAQQLQEYSTQLQQYQNQLQNTAVPSSYVWDAAQTTMSNLLGSIDTLSGYRSTLGSVNAYLDTYRDQNYYKTSPCFTVSGCTAAQRAALRTTEERAAEAQKRAFDASIRGIDQQQQGLTADATTLRRLQTNAQGATGQMQAIQFANQLASASGHQLLQIRALLIAQQNAETTRLQAQADKEARFAAASAQLRGGSAYRTSPARTW